MRNNDFTKALNELISGKHLSRQQTLACMTEILQDKPLEINQGAFLAAITANQPSPEEIAGVWQAIFETDTHKISPNVSKPMVDNCGTGMDGFKTFNISTAASIVAAAGGACMARHGARAITSRCGTVDVCEALGIDTECCVEVVGKSIETAGIGLFNGMSARVHPNALFRILSRISFGSILNIAASLSNPANPAFGVRGVYSSAMIEPVIRTMKEIGFKRALVFHGNTPAGGIDEISPIAETEVAELSEDGRIQRYTLMPEMLGVKPLTAIRDIAAGDHPRSEALRMLRILSGSECGGLYSAVCLNTAPIYYVAGHVHNLKQGVEKAREMIDSGSAMNKLREWCMAQNQDAQTGLHQLESLLEML